MSFEDQIAESLESNSESYQTISQIIKSLPDKQQIEVLEIANALKLSEGGPDDLLFQILVGLGYHKTLLAGIPDRLAAAGKSVETDISNSLADNKTQLINAGNQIAFGINSAVGEGAKQVLAASRKGAKEAIETADLSIILNKISSVAEDHSAWKWGRFGLNIAAVSGVAIICIGAVGGWFIKSAFPTPIPENYINAGFYMSQLKCASSDKYNALECTDKFKNKILLEWMVVKK